MSTASEFDKLFDSTLNSLRDLLMTNVEDRKKNIRKVENMILLCKNNNCLNNNSEANGQKLCDLNDITNDDLQFYLLRLSQSITKHLLKDKLTADS